MRRAIPFAVASVIALSTALVAPSAVAAPGGGPSTLGYPCSPGNFCIFSDWNGGGERCEWSVSKKANTADDCGFIQKGWNVRSVRNNTGHRVQYYTQTNYKARVGSTPKGGEGNLQGSYQIRSFKPQ
ncbi:peptidase inhibitor family I36 protein [Streptomyces sp. QH1-20]|uniref:peptidase inhibitor family I36 protein n=1 Tax=Streptomyces sp. QH1-20 TaxID=3240934 RepID=UPI003513103E